LEEKEKSAIDAIYEILKEIKIIKQEINVINKDIKLLNNKITKIYSPTAVAITSQSSGIQKEPNQSIKVFGRIKNQNQRPIKDVHITIFNPEGEILKSRSSDAEGYWEARIPPGQYVVELNASHINNKFRPKNINIELSDIIQEFEVK
jgi:hypothetical protein